MKKFFKIFLYTILVFFILAQFYPKPAKNSFPSILPEDITTVHQVPADVNQILKKSCYDCHSNNTVYPWYSRIQPVASWLGHHIKEAHKELNFSEFGSYTIRRQYKKLGEIDEQIKESKMPLPSYSFIHRSSRLNKQQRAILAAWANGLRDSFTINYPPDSLLWKK